jgi:uncharacterized protein
MQFHYDHVGTDGFEFIEIGHTTAVLGYRLAFYDGNPVAMSLYYETVIESPSLSGFTVINFINFLQDGNSTSAGLEGNGIALVHPDGTVLGFLSYEGSFVAADGPAAGMTSIDIGVRESDTTPICFSLQKCPNIPGNVRNGPLPNTATRANANCLFGAVPSSQPYRVPIEAPSQQTIVTPSLSTPVNTVWINEIHYDNNGTDVDEFIEIGHTISIVDIS